MDYMGRAHKLDKNNIFFFPTRRKDIIKRLHYTLEHTHDADMYLDPISHFSYIGACDKLCQAISIIEDLSKTKLLKNENSSLYKKTNKVLNTLYELQKKYVK